jgi:hypothetical protein
MLPPNDMHEPSYIKNVFIKMFSLTIFTLYNLYITFWTYVMLKYGPWNTTQSAVYLVTGQMRWFRLATGPRCFRLCMFFSLCHVGSYDIIMKLYCFLNCAVKSLDNLVLASDQWIVNDMKRSGICLMLITNKRLARRTEVNHTISQSGYPISGLRFYRCLEYKAEAIPASEWRLSVRMVKGYKSKMPGASPALLTYIWTVHVA